MFVCHECGARGQFTTFTHSLHGPWLNSVIIIRIKKDEFFLLFIEIFIREVGKVISKPTDISVI